MSTHDDREYSSLSMRKALKDGEWIRCSERLPSVRNLYQVTCESDDGERYVSEVVYDNTEWRTVNDPIIAWRELPEPYQGKP